MGNHSLLIRLKRQLNQDWKTENLLTKTVKQADYQAQNLGKRKSQFDMLKDCEPNYWLSCALINKEAMCQQVRGEKDALYVSEPGKSCPTEILEAIAAFNAEGRPIWKPMHMQPVYRMHPFITAPFIL